MKARKQRLTSEGGRGRKKGLKFLATSCVSDQCCGLLPWLMFATVR